jgi:phosphate starvation-inducible PhoH-like protein
MSKDKSARKDKSPKIPQDSKIPWDFNIKLPEWTDKQRQIISTILDKETKVVFINGVAGTGKTYLGIFCALELLRQKKISKINYIRTAVESADRSIGFLPGEAGEKIAPYARPLIDKLDEFLTKGMVDKLIKEEYVAVDLVNFLRGASINVESVITDESQNLSFKELVTILTRLGKKSKFIFIGDTMQSDINGKSGFKKIIDIFNDEESKNNGIHVFNLDKTDIMRSEELKFIIEKLEKSV